MTDEEAAEVFACQRELLETLVRENEGLRSKLAEREATIAQLQLAEALRQWKPDGRRRGRPKSADEEEDLRWLRGLERIQSERRLSRAAALRLLIDIQREMNKLNGLPRFNEIVIARQAATLLKRLATLAAKRHSNK